ncbi:MAG: hypothetical protein U5J97_00530 [Trueperaceae bacterium]|nr:hypothetical protein [Trueperaceae bacterium]
MSTSPPSWWSPCRIAVGEARRWTIGPASLTAERRAHEWRVTVATGDDPLEADLEVAEVVDPAQPATAGATTSTRRFAFDASPASLALEPRLADRDVVVRPADPLTIPAGQTTLLYVSTPLWFSAATVDPRHTLFEAPFFRPSDTWFGPSTVEGELCYASRTTGRLDLSELPVRPHRAITPVRIRNRAKEPLPLERLKLPVGILPLLAGPRGLWTPQIVLTNSEGADRADIVVQPGAPSEAGSVVAIAQPRGRPDTALSLRTFGRWLRQGAAS